MSAKAEAKKKPPAPTESDAPKASTDSEHQTRFRATLLLRDFRIAGQPRHTLYTCPMCGVDKIIGTFQPAHVIHCDAKQRLGVPVPWGGPEPPRATPGRAVSVAPAGPLTPPRASVGNLYSQPNGWTMCGECRALFDRGLFVIVLDPVRARDWWGPRWLARAPDALATDDDAKAMAAAAAAVNAANDVDVKSVAPAVVAATAAEAAPAAAAAAESPYLVRVLARDGSTVTTRAQAYARLGHLAVRLFGRRVALPYDQRGMEGTLPSPDVLAWRVRWAAAFYARGCPAYAVNTAPTDDYDDDNDDEAAPDAAGVGKQKTANGPNKVRDDDGKRVPSPERERAAACAALGIARPRSGRARGAGGAAPDWAETHACSPDRQRRAFRARVLLRDFGVVGGVPQHDEYACCMCGQGTHVDALRAVYVVGPAPKTRLGVPVPWRGAEPARAVPLGVLSIAPTSTAPPALTSPLATPDALHSAQNGWTMCISCQHSFERGKFVVVLDAARARDWWGARGLARVPDALATDDDAKAMAAAAAAAKAEAKSAPPPAAAGAAVAAGPAAPAIAVTAAAGPSASPYLVRVLAPDGSIATTRDQADGRLGTAFAARLFGRRVTLPYDARGLEGSLPPPDVLAWRVRWAAAFYARGCAAYAINTARPDDEEDGFDDDDDDDGGEEEDDDDDEVDTAGSDADSDVDANVTVR